MQAVGVVGTLPCIAFHAPLTSCVPQGQVHKASHPFLRADISRPAAPLKRPAKKAKAHGAQMARHSLNCAISVKPEPPVPGLVALEGLSQQDAEISLEHVHGSHNS